MTGVYTKRLLEAAGLNGSATAAVPVGKVWIVTNVSIAVSSSAFAGSGVVMRQGGAAFIIVAWPANAAYFLSWAGKAVLNAGETLLASLTTAQGAHLHVAGYQLDA